MHPQAASPGLAESRRGLEGRRRVSYLVPDQDRPSWGIGLLYGHVRLLRQLGIDARVLHHRAPFRVTWLEDDVPIDYLDADSLASSPSDVIVVPEVLAQEGPSLPKCHRLVFVQGSFLIARGLAGAQGFRELGYEAALAVLPHVAEILERYYDLPATTVPPFIAPYFFTTPEAIRSHPRRRTVLLSVKPEYRDFRIPDVEIIESVLRPRLAATGWELLELGGLAHRGVAGAMQEAAFLVSLNTHEAFNTTVPEAMAAGCIPICYEAFGGRDYLIDQENAHVFPNNHAYPLVQRALELARGFEEQPEALFPLRLAALDTASRFREEQTALALQEVFSS